MSWFQCTVGGSGKGNTVVVTCASEFAGETITLSKTGKTYTKTCPSSSPYTVTYYGVENGTYTVSATVDGQTYSETVVVQDISAVLNYGFNWQTWVDTSVDLDSTDYSTLADVLADEYAVRELFLVHDCVDYMASVASVNTNLATVINNDYCAKWINLSDYALDTLYANQAIATAMDTADKYFYGEWVITDSTTTPVTWGPKGNVPIMTSNTAPYGTASGTVNQTNYEPYRAFVDGGNPYSMNSNNSYLQYAFVNPMCIKRVLLTTGTATQYIANSYTIKGSNDGTNFTTLATISDAPSTASTPFVRNVSNDDYYLYIRVVFGSSSSGSINIPRAQFYGRELKVSVPTMTSNTAPYGVASAKDYSSGREPYKAFDNNTSNSWIGSSSSGCWIAYEFTKKIVPKMVYMFPFRSSGSAVTETWQLSGFNDGGTTYDAIEDLSVVIQQNGKAQYFTLDNTDEYQKIKLTETTQWAIRDLQIWGLDYSEKEFANDGSKWLYDHGLLLNNFTWDDTATYTGGGYTRQGTITDGSNGFRMLDTKSGSGYTFLSRAVNEQIDFSSYNLLRYSKSIGNILDSGVDVSAVSAQYYIGIFVIHNNGDSARNHSIIISSQKTLMYDNKVAYFFDQASSNPINDITELWLE